MESAGEVGQMLAEAGQKEDAVCSYGMKLSWDINDPQMPQVRETDVGAHVALAIHKRAGGVQVLVGTEERPPLPPPHLPRVLNG